VFWAFNGLTHFHGKLGHRGGFVLITLEKEF